MLLKDERYEKGVELLQKMSGLDRFPPIDAIREVYPPFADFIVMNGFSDIYARPGLDAKQRELITLSSLITQGAFDQLNFHVHAALNAGVLPIELVELVIHCSAYTGFPKAIGAFQVVMQIFEEREIRIYD
jgi:4-carboxymuconolactone decarboxylase